MNIVIAFLWLVITPGFYWGTGILAASFWPEEKVEKAAIPLLGVVFWGWVGLLQIMSGVPRGWLYSGIAAVAIAGGLHQWKRVVKMGRDWGECVRPSLGIYLLSVVALAVSAYPGLWLIGGDWWVHFSMTLAADHGQFGVDQLTRCPFFAVACLPLLDAGGGTWARGLAVYQIFNAVAAAAAWLPIVMLILKTDQAGRAVRVAALLALGCSPMFTMVLQNLWPKFLAGGCLWLALTRAEKFAVDGRITEMRWAGWWFACAVLAHESSIIYAPLLALAAWVGPGVRGKLPLIIGLAWAGIIVALLVGCWEGWTVWRFGWGARVNANPAVAFATSQPLWEKFGANILAVLVSILPLDLAATWVRPHLGFLDKSYYTVVAIVSWMGATVLGIVLPWLLFLRKAAARLATDYWLEKRQRILLAGAAIAVVAYAFILPVAPRYGTIQGGLVPLVMGMTAMVVSRLGAEDARGVSRLLRWWVFVGWLPYVAVGTVIGIILGFPEHFGSRAEQLRLQDGDLMAVYTEKFAPLGMMPMTLLLGFCAAIAIGWQLYRLAGKLDPNGRTK